MLRRVAALAVALAAICCGSLLGVNLAAAAPTASISGVVTNSSGEGIANASVLVYRSGVVAGSATTASDGSYTVGSLAAGSYTVSFRPPPAPASGPDTANYLPQNYSDRSPSADADPVTVQAGATTTGIDAALQAGGMLSGVVVDNSGNPVAGINVGAYDSDGVDVGSSATTAPDGSYSIDRLPTGEYSVSFLPDTRTPKYVSDYSGGSPTIAGAYGVAVTAGSTTSGVDAHLVDGGTITGTVTDTSDAPIENVGVEIYDSSGNIVANAATAADGTFALTGLASGTYRVGFTPEGGPDSERPNYLPSYYGGSSTLAGAASVVVAAGATTAGIDAQLAAGAEIDGTVTDTADKPLAGVGVTVYASDGTAVLFASTAGDGSYQMPGLASGSYKIGFDPSGGSVVLNNVASFYGGSSLATATTVAVTAGDAPAVINAQLAAGTTISGTVTDSLGDPLGDVPVLAYDAAGNVVGGGTSARFSGDYEIEGLPADTYRLGFNQAQGCCSLAGDYSPQFSGDKSTLASAQTVTVTGGGSATGVNAALGAGGQISGRVTDANGAPLGDITVEVFDSSGNVVAATESFDDGTYWLSGLASGSYRLQYAGSFAVAGPLVDTEYYGGSATLSGASGVAVTAGATTSGVDMQLARTTGGIAGVVTDGTGTPLAGASVTVYDLPGNAVQTGTLTAADGSFSIAGLEPGFYRVGFALAGHTSAYYPGAASLSAAQPFYVASAATASGINAALASLTATTPPPAQPPAEPPLSPPAPPQPPSYVGPPASSGELVVLPSVAKLRLSSRRGFRIPVRCLETTPCKGKVTLSVVHRKASEKVGSGSVKIAPGGGHFATVKLNGAGMKLFLAAKHRLRVTVTLSIVGSGTQTQTVGESVLIV